MEEAQNGGLIDKSWIITFIVIPIIIILLVVLILNCIGYYGYHSDYPNAVNTSVNIQQFPSYTVSGNGCIISRNEVNISQPKIICSNYTIKDNYYYCNIDDVKVLP